MSKLERRMFSTEFRAVKEDGKPTRLAGYAAVYNSASEDLGGFTEEIAAGAFKDVLANNPDCRCLFNHNPDNILGRTTAGTLTLREDSLGLHYDCLPPDTTLGRDLMVLAERKDITQSSFGFTVDEEDWFDRNGKSVAPWSYEGVKRVVRKVGALYDVSPVTYPAYTASSVEARSKFLFPEGHPERREKREAGEVSLQERIDDLQDALNVKYPADSASNCWGAGKYWALEVYSASAIIYDTTDTDEYFRITYTVDDAGEPVLGDTLEPVEKTWVPSEAASARMAAPKLANARKEAKRQLAKRRLALRRKK